MLNKDILKSRLLFQRYYQLSSSEARQGIQAFLKYNKFCFIDYIVFLKEFLPFREWPTKKYLFLLSFQKVEIELNKTVWTFPGCKYSWLELVVILMRLLEVCNLNKKTKCKKRHIVIIHKNKSKNSFFLLLSLL